MLATRPTWAASRPEQSDPAVDLEPVDTLKVTCLVDFTSDGTLKGSQASDLSIARPDGAKGAVANGKRSTHLLAEYGLALLIQSRRGDEKFTILHDFGLSGQALLNNLDYMNFDPGEVDAMVLSHGHIDHYGGLAKFLATYKDRLVRHPALYVGHDDVFAPRWKVKGEKKSFQGQLDRNDVAENARIVLANDPIVMGGHACLSGTIPMTAEHELSSPSARVEKQGSLEKDRFEEELAICYRLQDKGLVVIMACAHRGLVNTVAHTRAVTGVDRVHAVLGGLHLAKTPPRAFDKTIGALEAWQVKHVVPMHCTGAAATDNLHRRLSQQTRANATGTVLSWS